MIKRFETNNFITNVNPFKYHLDWTYANSQSPKGNWHENIEILYFINGEGKVSCDGNVTNVKQGDIYVVNSYLLHDIITDNKVTYYYLIPDNNFCVTNGIDLSSINFQSLIQDQKLYSMFDKFTECFHSKNLYRNTKLRTMLLSILVYLAENYSTQDTKSDCKNSIEKNIHHAIGYIKSHLDEKITIEQISELVNLSRYYFMREFKKATGYTPIAFINKSRCEIAKRLLLTGSFSMGEICEKCGFESLSYFARVFKLYTGMTPSEYAKLTPQNSSDRKYNP